MYTRRNITTIMSLALSAALLAGGTGCGWKSASWKPSEVFSLDNAWPFEGDDEPEQGIPVRLVGAWTDTVMTKPGQKPQRGFGGRIIFYGEKDEEPILVDGQLVVYAFDEAGRQPTDNKPTRRYVFPADQMPRHMSKSDIGVSYSFWLPWDEAGGQKSEVSLICRFEPKGGAVITGEQTRHLLPGAFETETAATRSGPPPIPEGEPSRPAQTTLESLQSQRQIHDGAQLASYESAAKPQTADVSATADAAAAPPRQMTVTSIALPNNFQMPDAAPNAPPASTPAGPLSPPLPKQQLAPPAQFQQPAAGARPIHQTQQLNTSAQRPIGSTVAAPITYVPQTGSYPAPTPTPQYTGQQTQLTQTGQPVLAPAGTPMVGPTAPMGAYPQAQMGMQPGTMPQQPVLPQQPMVMAPGQPIAPQQAWQQLPVANGVRTAVSYPPAGAVPFR